MAGWVVGLGGPGGLDICPVRSFDNVETNKIPGDQFCRVGLFVYVLKAARSRVGRCAGGWTRSYTRRGGAQLPRRWRLDVEKRQPCARADCNDRRYFEYQTTASAVSCLQKTTGGTSNIKTTALFFPEQPAVLRISSSVRFSIKIAKIPHAQFVACIK